MRRRKVYPLKLFPLLLCLLLLLLPAGCVQDFWPQISEEREEEEKVIPREEEQKKEELPEGVLALLVYFPEGSGRYLVPVTVTLPWTEGVARAALEKLIEGPSPAQEMRYGFVSYLPPNTKVLGLTIRDGVARVDLNSPFLHYDPGKEKAVLGSIIYTLLQFPSVEEVELLVEGSPVEELPGGAVVEGTFDRSWGLNLEVAEEVLDFGNTSQLRLYFCSLLGGNNIFYVPVTRVVESGEDLLEQTLNELLKGPRPGSDLFSEFPEETRLLNFTVQENIVVVNFSKELLNYRGGLAGEENIKNQLLLTLTEIPTVEKVQVLVEGEKVTLGYGTSFHDPLPRPRMLNLLQ